MHPRTHAAWMASNDALRDLDREITDLISTLETRGRAGENEQAGLDRRASEALSTIVTRLAALVARADELQALRVR